MISAPDIADHPARILIVDDDPHERQLLEVMLTPEGFHLLTAASGEEALAMVAQQPPDLILLDVRLPGVDGYQVAAKIKGNVDTQNIPIIMVTVLDDHNAKMLGLSAGAEDFVTKPVERAELSVRVRNLLRLKAYGDYYGKYSEMLEGEVRSRTATLRETSQRLQAIVDAAPVAIIAADWAGPVVLWSKAATELLGWTEEEMLGKAIATIPDERRAEFEAARARNSRGEPTLYETQRLRKDGSLVDVITSTAPLTGPDGSVTGTLGILVDTTERKQLEDQLRQAVKMEGIGRLAGGVAHDFNNLLTVIGGRTYLLLNELPADHPMHRDLLVIQQTGERAAALTRQLLAFSRKQILKPTVLNLNEVVSNLRSLLERLLGEDVELVINLDPGLSSVMADHGQLEQVIVNLAVNARDAMLSGGRLTIETADVALDESHSRQYVDVASGTYVSLTVSDTGIGMDQATQAQIFEPFFTTKEVGKGTGLGLATVYGIIKQSNGHITVDSNAGIGTVFRIYLPRTAEAGTAKTEVERDTSPRGTETLLLAEDDLDLRTLARDILEIQGYTVLEAADVEDAMRIAEHHEGVIQLLITDVVMPRMNGRALADAVRRHRPNIKMLFMSGYTDNAIVHHGVLEPGTPFLQKPFTLGTLGRKVREVLDRPS